MVWSLLTHRSQWEAVRADRSLLAKTFEESVRFKDPGRGPIRLATRDTEIRGVPIPQGSLIQLCTMAADHDETVFDRAEQFDIFRDDLKIAPAWGRGIDRKSVVSGKGGSVRVDLGGRGLIKHKNTDYKKQRG